MAAVVSRYPCGKFHQYIVTVATGVIRLSLSKRAFHPKVILRHKVPPRKQNRSVASSFQCELGLMSY